VSGVNFMIPHSFNPRSPFDTDCPPYFYNGGFEPRYPLYRVYADYTSRLTLMLTGGRHVCPVAILFNGNVRRVGKAITPEDMTTLLQNTLFDCDWMPFDVFETDARLAGGEVQLHKEIYKVLVVPPVEVIPYAALEKARRFFDGGGVVVGYGFLPGRSATLGKTSADVAALREAIWGAADKPPRDACKTSPAGGRSYFLPASPTPRDLRQALTADAGIHPTLEVLEGTTDNWLHVLHRVKAAHHVFLVCNQNHKGDARRFKFRATAKGVPQRWDAMRNEINSIAYQPAGDDAVDFELTLEPNESVLVVFGDKPQGPARLAADARPSQAVEIAREPWTGPDPNPSPVRKAADRPNFAGCKWVWYPEADAASSVPPCTRYFRQTIDLPAGRNIKAARFHITCDNQFVLYVNATEAAKDDGGTDSWRRPQTADVAGLLRAGTNVLAVKAVNLDSPNSKTNPAGLLGRLVVEYEQGGPVVLDVDGRWKASEKEQPQWTAAAFDDKLWGAAKEIAPFGQGPWGTLEQRGGGLTLSPVKADPFRGRCTLPAGVDLAKDRVCVELDAIAPEEAARITVNGAYAGGFIGKPFRLDVTRHLKAGENVIEIQPFAPGSAKLAVYKP